MVGLSVIGLIGLFHGNPLNEKRVLVFYATLAIIGFHGNPLNEKRVLVFYATLAIIGLGAICWGLIGVKMICFGTFGILLVN